MTEAEPVRSQRNETAVRWFLVDLLEPADQRTALERELAFCEAELERLNAIAAAIDASDGRKRFRGTVDLGLRMTGVMRDWLQEQLSRA